MNAFEDNDHALLTGVVLGSFRAKGIEADAMLNDVEDSTPYLRVKFDHGVEAVIVVLPGN
jgi:hypothetical protein